MLLHSFVLCSAAFIAITSAQQTPRPPTSICAGRPAGHLLRDVTQCNAFFRCAGDAAGATFTRHLCSEPAHVFHQSQQRCVAVTTGGNAHCFRCPAQHALVDVAVADACGHFVRCLGGQAQQLECPRGTLFDRRTESCAPAERVRCEETTIPAIRCPEQDTVGRPRLWVRDAHDCAVYRVCVNGRAVRGECAPGAHFNERTHTCDLPQNAGCRLGSGPGHQPQPPLDPSWPPTAARPFRCAEQQPLPRPIYPHARDCTRFWVCDRLQNAFPRQCPAGTRFDMVQQVCDSPQRAVCAPGTWMNFGAGAGAMEH